MADFVLEFEGLVLEGTVEGEEVGDYLGAIKGQGLGQEGQGGVLRMRVGVEGTEVGGEEGHVEADVVVVLGCED